MLKDLVKSSRSIRSFKADSVITENMLMEICSIARDCPAAMNLQPLKYRLVTKKEELDQMLENTRWAASLEQKLPPKGHAPSGYIVICHDTNITPQKPIFMIDVGIVAQTMMLAARERGLGGCMIGSAKEEVIRNILSLPESLVPVLVLGLGVPDETIILTDAEDGNVKYYRDENNIHYVPKRPIDELIIK